MNLLRRIAVYSGTTGACMFCTTNYAICQFRGLAEETMSALMILAAERDIMLQINNDDVISRLVRH